MFLILFYYLIKKVTFSYDNFNNLSKIFTFV